jgi:proline dehydrogenase
VIDRAIAHLSPRFRDVLLRRSSRRLIGGETLAKACCLGASLNAEGKHATLGLLGENVASEKEARSIAAEERRALEEIEVQGLDAALSVKLSALGLGLDEELCFELLLVLAAAADEKENIVLIDMESADAIDATLRLYRRLRGEGLDNISLALQARSSRTLGDIEALAPLSPRISICKGSYEVPPDGAASSEGQVRERFLRAISRLADAASAIGVSTHDHDLITESLRLLAVAGRPRADYELQMLYGVAPRLESELAGGGEPLRIYIPYGADWYPYVRRRLAR